MNYNHKNMMERDLGIKFPVRRSVRERVKKALLRKLDKEKQKEVHYKIVIKDLKYRNELLVKKIQRLEKKLGICNK